MYLSKGREEMGKIKIYIYGAGCQYNKFLSYVLAYSEKIEVIGIVTTERQRVKKLDGYPCITASEMQMDEADYIIIAVEKWKEIAVYLKSLGIESEKIIPSKVFSLPYFELDSYLALKKKKITILSNTCLAVDVYKELGMEYTSPTIALLCEGDNYLSFLENYRHYLSNDMLLSNNNNNNNNKGLLYCSEYLIPRGILDDEVEWIFLHSTDIEKDIEKWNERRRRCNLDDVAVLMVIFTDEEAERFEKLPYKKKLGIYYEDLNLKSVLYCSEWKDINILAKYNYNWVHFANNYMTSDYGMIGKINWTKFLLGEDDFIRF